MLMCLEERLNIFTDFVFFIIFFIFNIESGTNVIFVAFNSSGKNTLITLFTLSIIGSDRPEQTV